MDDARECIRKSEVKRFFSVFVQYKTPDDMLSVSMASHSPCWSLLVILVIKRSCTFGQWYETVPIIVSRVVGIVVHKQFVIEQEVGR